jgi:outer membrane protein OmpA-like peptidoglycan-associated protein
VIDKTGQVVDTVLNKTERGIGRAFAGVTGGADSLGADLADGRAVLSGVGFADGSDALTVASEPYLARLAKLIAGGGATYLLEAHVAPRGDAVADQALSDRRAATVKTRLVAAGVPATRIFALGYGSTRPMPAGGTADRVELVTMR